MRSIGGSSASSQFRIIRVFKVTRLLQVVRSIRLVRFLSALRALVLSVIDTTRQLLWALILLTLVSRSKASLETRVSTVEVVSSSKLPKGENI
eukprot:g14846.t1